MLDFFVAVFFVAVFLAAVFFAVAFFGLLVLAVCVIGSSDAAFFAADDFVGFFAAFAVVVLDAVVDLGVGDLLAFVDFLFAASVAPAVFFPAVLVAVVVALFFGAAVFTDFAGALFAGVGRAAFFLVVGLASLAARLAAVADGRAFFDFAAPTALAVFCVVGRAVTDFFTAFFFTDAVAVLVLPAADFLTVALAFD